jgi:hypothetical protein
MIYPYQDLSSKGYVLYVEHDYSPHNVWVCRDLAEVRSKLAAYFVRGATGDSTFPWGRTVEQLADHGEYVRIYQCGDSGSLEVDPTELQQKEAA